MAARKNRGTSETGLPQEWKDKCKAAYIANRFMKCFDGEVELTPAQLKAGEILFKRLEPELSRTDTNITGSMELKKALPITPPEQLAAIDAAINAKY